MRKVSETGEDAIFASGIQLNRSLAACRQLALPFGRGEVDGTVVGGRGGRGG